MDVVSLDPFPLEVADLLWPYLLCENAWSYESYGKQRHLSAMSSSLRALGWAA